MRTIKPVTLSVAKQEKFKEQILLVLADYQNSKRNLMEEGTRLQIAQRIMDNMRVVAALKG